MSHVIRRVLYLSMGFLSGIAVWPAMELLLAHQGSFQWYLSFSVASGALFGGVVGAFIGAVDGMVAGATRRAIEGALFGAGVGALGGGIGFVLGQSLLLMFGATNAIEIALFRTAGWAVMGASVAFAEGTRRRSVRRAAVGLLGGFLGGVLGGIAVETIPLFLPVTYARPIALGFYGCAVTGMYGLFERRITVGVLRLLNGRSKGKEFILNQRTTEVGTRKGADVFLSGYRGVESSHAHLQEVNGELIVFPADEEIVVKRNDERVEANGSGLLKYGDVLQFGTAKFLFKPLAVLVGLLFTVSAVVPPRAIGAEERIAAASAEVEPSNSTMRNDSSIDATDASDRSGAISGIRIAEVNTRRVILDQTVQLYLGITDSRGRSLPGLSIEDLTIDEATETGAFRPVEILSVEAGVTADEGITFFLLIDNSGSMYDRIDGTPTNTYSETRMAAVQAAVRQFLDSVDNPLDRIAVATFNTNYTLLTDPTNSLRTIDALLEEIEQPQPDGAYTELFRGVIAATEDLSEAKGRRVLIVLSDGEDYPFARHAGRPHPTFGSVYASRDDAIAGIRMHGIGVFGIDFTGSGDPGLADIARDGGGTVYLARSESALETVYRGIRSLILDEYRLRYRASILPTEFRRVRVSPATGPEPQAVRRYFAGTIFGEPRDDFGIAFAIPFFAAIAGALLLGQLRPRNSRSTANVELFDATGKATQIVDLTSEKTVVGGADAADITIAGSPDLKDNHATILHDSQRDTYTVVATEPIVVNNRQTTRRVLEPGDVVELPGTTVVFDVPEKAKGGRTRGDGATR
jgi:Mg-chelatase subunit ChlD